MKSQLDGEPMSVEDFLKSLDEAAERSEERKRKEQEKRKEQKK